MLLFVRSFISCNSVYVSFCVCMLLLGVDVQFEVDCIGGFVGGCFNRLLVVFDVCALWWWL